MQFSVFRRFSIQLLQFVDLKWTRSIFGAVMFVAIVLYTATVLCPIASGLPKLPIQVSNTFRGSRRFLKIIIENRIFGSSIPFNRAA